MQGIQQGWANVFWNGPSLKNSDFWWATKFSEKLNDFQSWWSMRNTLSLNTKLQNTVSDYRYMYSFRFQYLVFCYISNSLLHNMKILQNVDFYQRPVGHKWPTGCSLSTSWYTVLASAWILLYSNITIMLDWVIHPILVCPGHVIFWLKSLFSDETTLRLL